MKERIITGLIGAIVFLSILYLGGTCFSFFVLILAIVGYGELVKMLKVEFLSFPSLAGFAALILLYLPLFMDSNIEFKSVITGLFLLMMLGILFTKNKVTIEKASVLFIGVIYIGMGFLYFAEARLHEGLYMVLFIMLLIWTTDSGAYFVGRKLGKRKLYEIISPNKTIEGSIGGVVLSILLGVVFFYTTNLFDSIYNVVLISIVVSIFGQVGDLIQSAMKRQFGVKDSGKLLPGHGGILDRFDSLLFVFPILFLLQII